MSPTNPANETESIETRLLLEAIHLKYGYDLRDYSATPIQRRVHAALAKTGLSNVSELQHRILRDPELFATVLEDLTVRVSEMFRDPTFYRAFRDCVAPVLHTYPQLRIWHSGCATGEEVYATAILLTEEGLYERSQIYATDLSAQALEQAKQAIYSVNQLKTFAENYEKSGGKEDFSKYYTAAYDGIAFSDSLRRNVLFFQHNLVSDHPFGEMHVIFCRNVLIYFDGALRDRVLRKFSQSLCPGGFLCLGSSEHLSTSIRDFAPFSEERIYRHER